MYSNSVALVVVADVPPALDSSESYGGILQIPSGQHMATAANLYHQNQHFCQSCWG